MEYEPLFKGIDSYGVVEVTENLVKVTRTTLKFVAENQRRRPYHTTIYINARTGADPKKVAESVVQRVEHELIDVDVIRLKGINSIILALYDQIKLGLPKSVFIVPPENEKKNYAAVAASSK